jgi:hypothetical protein
MRLDLVHADGLKRAIPHVQRDGCALHALSCKRVHQLGREVEAGSRSGNRSALRCIDCLIPLAIVNAIAALDVRRQGHVADSVDNDVERRARGNGEAYRPPAMKPSIENLAAQRMTGALENEPRALVQSLAWVHEALPDIRVEPSNEQTFGGAAARQSFTKKSRRKNLAVVDHEKIATAKQRRQIPKSMMRNATADAVQDEQSRAATLGGWFLSNQLGGQIEIELSDVQADSVQKKGPDTPGMPDPVEDQQIVGLRLWPEARDVMEGTRLGGA